MFGAMIDMQIFRRDNFAQRGHAFWYRACFKLHLVTWRAFIGWRCAFPLTSNYTLPKIWFSMPLLRTSSMSTCLFPNSSAESLGLVARVSRKRFLALPLEGSWTRHNCYLRCSCCCFFFCFLHSLTLLALQYLQKKTFVLFWCGGKDCPLKLLVANENQGFGLFLVK